MKLFKQNAEDTTNLLKQQLNTVKSYFRAINNMLLDVAYNESLLKERISKITIILTLWNHEMVKKWTYSAQKLKQEGTF
jgi:hypothetical protein